MSIAGDPILKPQMEEGGPPRSRKDGHLPAFSIQKSSRLPWVFAALAILVAGGGGTALYLMRNSTTDNTILTYVVRRESFDVTIPLNGEMKASRNVEIRSQVEGSPTILSVVREGTRVKEGDVLVTLTSDVIKDRLEDARIRLENAVSATVNADETVRIQQSQNDSDLKTAEINAEIARLEYEQFDKGDSKVQVDTYITALENAKTDLERKTKDLEKMQELLRKQFVSENDRLDAVIAERDSRNKLNTAEMNLKVWQDYSEPRQRQTLKRKMDAAAAELERTKARGNAQLMWREADLRAKQSTQRVEEGRHKSLQAQLEACTIRAPQLGMVVYQSSLGGNQNQGPIEEGATVRQNQVLIQLPDTSRMLAEVRIPEQLIEKVRREQEATVTVDAVPGKMFHGRVESIAVLPDSSNRWANPNLKEYITQIGLDELDPAFKPGFSVKVEILVDHVDDVVAVPVQAVFNAGGQPYVFVGSAEHFEKRTIKTGLSSSTRIEVKEGLTPGDIILLARPKSAQDETGGDSDKDKKRGGTSSRGRGNGNGGGGGGGGRGRGGGPS